MDDEVREMLQRLNFSKDELKKVMSQNKIATEGKDWEGSTVGKILTKEKIHKESMYRVLRYLWYTKEWVNFVDMEEKKELSW